METFRAQSKDEEVQRVEKELSHIRENYINPKKLNPYGRKKYSLKLMYISILGYTVDFGHMEAMELLRSNNYQDKSIGYLVLGALLNENSELVRLINQSLLADLTSPRDHYKTLSLTFIGNNGNAETAEILANNVCKLLMDKTAPSYIIKKSALCLLHLYRKNPESIQGESWNERIITLLSHRDGGVLTSVTNLLLGVASGNAAAYQDLVPHVASLVHKVIFEKYVTGDYMYDNIPSPWLVVNCLRFLQLFDQLPNKQVATDIVTTLRRILNTETKNFISVDRRTRMLIRHGGMMAVLFEAINLVVQLRPEPELIKRSISHVRILLQVNDPDTRYLALEAMRGLCPLDSKLTGDDPEVINLINKLLSHPDISVRRRAMDVMFEMCSQNNSKEIVGKLLQYLGEAELDLREEMVLKIAILAEKYPVSMEWYVDVIMRLLQGAGNNTPQEIWFRTVQIISQHEDMQIYGASVAGVMLRTLNLPEPAVRICSFLAGEYISKVKLGADNGELTIKEVVEKLTYHTMRSSPSTRAIIITSLSKICAYVKAYQAQIENSQDIITLCEEALKKGTTASAEEVQERSCAFLSLLTNATTEGIEKVLAPLPPFAARQSLLLKGLKKKMKESGGLERKTRHLEGVTDEEENEEGEEDAPITDTNGFAPPPNEGAGSSSAQAEQPVQQDEDDGLIDLGIDLPKAQPVPQQQTQAPSVQSSNMSGMSQPLPSSQPTVAPTTSDDPNALLAMLTAAESAPPPPTNQPVSVGETKPAAPVNPLMAAFGITAEQTQPLPPPESNPQLEFMYNMLICSPEGNIYDDNNLTIHCQHSYNKHEGRIMLTYKNKSSINLTQLTASIEPTSSDLTLQIEPLAVTIPMGGNVVQRILVSAVSPFATSPIITLSYAGPTGVVRCLVKLPCVAMQFFTPLQPPNEMFIQQWNSIPDNSPLSQEEVMLFKKQPFNAETLKVLCAFLEGPAHCASLPGADPTPQTLCFAAGMNCGSANGNPMPLMIKLTMAPPPPMSPQPGMIKLTVKGCTDKLAIATKNSVFSTLAKM